MKSNINKRNRVRNVVAYGIVSNLNQPHCTSLKLPGSPGHQFWRCTLWSSAPGFWISIPTVNQWWTSNYSPQLVVGYSLTLILYEYSVFYRKSGFIFLNQFTYKCLLQNLVGFCMFWRPRIIGGFTFFPPPTMCTDRTSPMKTGRCERANLIAKITVAMATTCPTPAEHMELRIFESKTRSWSNALITFKHVSSKTKLWWVFGAKAKKSITNQFPAPTSTSAPRAAVHIEQRFDRSWGSPVPSVRGLMLLGATSTCMALGIGLWLRTCEKMTYPTCTSSLTQKAILLANIIIIYYLPLHHRLNTSTSFLLESYDKTAKVFKTDWNVNGQTSQLFLQDFCRPRLSTNRAYISPTSEKKLSSELHPLQFGGVTHAIRSSHDESVPVLAFGIRKKDTSKITCALA